MDIKINIRDNGACPLCKFHEKCTIQELIRNSMDKKIMKKKEYMELVIYRCPQFVEEGPEFDKPVK